METTGHEVAKKGVREKSWAKKGGWRRRRVGAARQKIKKGGKSKRRLTFAVALIGDGNGATCAAGGESQVAGTLVGVSVGPADGAHGGSLLRRRLGAPAGAPHAVRAQVLVQKATPALAATDPCARTCSTLYTLLRTVINRPREIDASPSLYVRMYVARIRPGCGFPNGSVVRFSSRGCSEGGWGSGGLKLDVARRGPLMDR